MPKFSNCLFWALSKFIKDVGYLVVRRCRHHRWCLHYLWMPAEGEPLEQYTSDGKHPTWVSKIMYRGRVKIGDTE